MKYKYVYTEILSSNVCQKIANKSYWRIPLNHKLQ